MTADVIPKVPGPPRLHGSPRVSTSTGASSETTLTVKEKGGQRLHRKLSKGPASAERNDVKTSQDSVDPGDSAPRQDGGRDGGSVSPNRPKTFWRAMHKLCTLDERTVAAFMESYIIYGLDWKDEEAMREKLGDNFQQRVGECLRAYYGVLNYLCALGDVEKMYIPPLMDKRLSVRENQMRYEESVARDIGLKAGDHVLDLGCGRGRVAAHMAAHVPGVVVTGLNIDPEQIAQARSFNDKRRLSNTFVERDFNELPLPFESGTFDGFYQIQALSLCRDLPALFKELFRVLKPGARISLLDWVSLPPYDPSNAEHTELMRRVKPLIGAVGTPTPLSLEEDLRAAGFIVTKSENASVGGLQAPLIDKVDVYFRALRRLVIGLVRLRVLPPHLSTVFTRLCLDGQAFVKMDKMGLITTSYSIIAQKPMGDQPAREQHP